MLQARRRQSPENLERRKLEGRWRRYTEEEIFWLCDNSLGDLDNLPEPDEIAEEIIGNLTTRMEIFRSVLFALQT